jgi:NAD(P)-dependent dehydrogenase (short-subunit alcohol dehydrogenase family)
MYPHFISYIPTAKYSSYTVSKAANVMLFNSLQLENPELRVVNIHPGIVGHDWGQDFG